MLRLLILCYIVPNSMYVLFSLVLTLLIKEPLVNLSIPFWGSGRHSYISKIFLFYYFNS